MRNWAADGRKNEMRIGLCQETWKAGRGCMVRPERFELPTY